MPLNCNKALGLLLCLSAVATTVTTTAHQLALPRVFGSSMVFQHSEPIVLWGTAPPGHLVTCVFAQNAACASPPCLFRATATASAAGEWQAVLPASPPSTVARHGTSAAGVGGWTLTVTSGVDSITLHDIVVGLVYVCSGQSNMEVWSHVCA